MTRNARVSILLAVAAIVGVVVVLLATSGDDASTSKAAKATPTPAADTAGAPQVVRKNSHRLDTAGADAPTLVEFLDFECEGCGALFPVMEQLRQKYDGRLNFVIRYFPNQGHFNGQLAAQVAEAAARQDKLEEMYKRLFETQREWGEAQEPKTDFFIGLAEEIGLDLKRFRADLKSADVKKRVNQDLNEGLALGVSGTPTLFLDGQQLQLSTVDQLMADVEAAVAQ